MDQREEGGRDQLGAAARAAEAAEAALYAAAATEEVLRAGGLRYAALSTARDRYVAGCDGRLLGHLEPAAPGRALGGWTACPLDAPVRLGGFPTARAAAAALARRCGVR